MPSARRWRGARKRALAGIFEAIEQLDFETAANLCMQRFESKARYWLYAARIGAELLLRLKRFDDARVLYEAIIEAKTVPWARLGWRAPKWARATCRPRAARWRT